MQVADTMAHGYLPQELPPSFTSRPFAAVSGSLTASPPRDWTNPVVLNLARPGSLRRRLSIPNPFSELALVMECSNGWTEIQALLTQSPISLSRPIIDPTKRRSLCAHKTLSERVEERAYRMNRARYVFASDVSECYSSIYTHSIEWALHGKEASKRRLSTLPKPADPLGARLDAAVRHGQEGQTKGIPISPDSSLVLAEIVLCAIDLELQQEHPSIGPYCLRHIDDIEFFSSSQTEAEDVLLTWQSKLANYGLMVNPSKTKISEAPLALESPWRTTLSQFTIRSTSDRQTANDIYSFFSAAFELARAYRAEPVLGYAVTKAAASVQGPLSWSALEPLLLASFAVEPSCLRYVASALARSELNGRALSAARLEESLNDLCEYHARREHGSEVTWALWTIARFGLSVSQSAAKAVSLMLDNCALILLNDLISQRRIIGTAPDMSVAIGRAEAPGAWRSDDWLLAYEYARNGWASDANIRAATHWKELLDLDVYFFKVPVTPPSRLPSSASATAAPAPAAPAPAAPAPAAPAPAAPAPAAPAPAAPAPATLPANSPALRTPRPIPPWESGATTEDGTKEDDEDEECEDEEYEDFWFMQPRTPMGYL